MLFTPVRCNLSCIDRESKLHFSVLRTRSKERHHHNWRYVHNRQTTICKHFMYTFDSVYNRKGLNRAVKKDWPVAPTKLKSALH